MKKLLLVLFLMFAVSAAAMAATNGEIVCQCNAVASVAVSTDTHGDGQTFVTGGDWNDAQAQFNLGLVYTGYTCVTPKPFYIWNTSPGTASAVQIYQLYGADTTSGGTNWSLSSGTWANGVDSYAVCGVFSMDTAGTAETWDNAGALYAVGGATNWNTTRFNNTSSKYPNQKHGNLVAGTPTYRQLWIAIMTPSAVSGTSSETIPIYVIAALAGT